MSMNNEYIKRKVADKDVQLCLICHKLTSTVLFNKSGPDWIYSCDIHLDDNPQFVTPLYSDDYYKAVETLKYCQERLSQLYSKDAQSKSWDGWITTIFNKRKEVEKNKNKNKDKIEEEIKDDAEDNSTTADTPELVRKELQSRYDKALATMNMLQKQNKRFKLSDKMFQYRVQLRRDQARKLHQRKRQEELMRREEANYSNTDPSELTLKFNFPTTPNNKLK